MINAISSGGSRNIILSKRANIFYLEKVRVYVRNERVVYQIVQKDGLLDYNIPDCNTSLLLLGKGSSVTDAAVRALAKSGVIIGFAGSGGTPPHAMVDYCFLNPADEYRPTKYCQTWVQNWFNPDWRLSQAREWTLLRLVNTQRGWSKIGSDFSIDLSCGDDSLLQAEKGIKSAKNETELLLVEARWAKTCYATLAQIANLKFSRKPGAGEDRVNGMLDHGNYLMYGLGAVALHALGIPPAFPLLHGKTRRGGLVFDVADLMKDAYIMPLAFMMEAKNKSKKDFRVKAIDVLQKEEILDGMIKTIKKTLIT